MSLGVSLRGLTVICPKSFSEREHDKTEINGSNSHLIFYSVGVILK